MQIFPYLLSLYNLKKIIIYKKNKGHLGNGQNHQVLNGMQAKPLSCEQESGKNTLIHLNDFQSN